MKMTPRKLFSLLMVHYDIERQKNGKNPTRNTKNSVKPNGFIDTLPGW